MIFFWANWQTAHHLISNAFFRSKTLNPLSNQPVSCSFGAALGRSLMKSIFILSFWDLAFAGTTNSDDSRHQWLKYSRHLSFSLDSTNDEAASCLHIRIDWQVEMPIVLWRSAARSHWKSQSLDRGRFSIDFKSIKNQQFIQPFFKHYYWMTKCSQDWIDCLMYLNTCI